MQIQLGKILSGADIWWNNNNRLFFTDYFMRTKELVLSRTRLANITRLRFKKRVSLFTVLLLNIFAKLIRANHQ